MILHRAMMFNNYGRHSHSFRARPTGFSWDWLSFPGAMTAAFCISINGSFLCGLRGLPANVALGARLLAGEAAGTGAGQHGGDLELGGAPAYGPGRRMAQA